jgi:hypothetical protein
MVSKACLIYGIMKLLRKLQPLSSCTGATGQPPVIMRAGRGYIRSSTDGKGREEIACTYEQPDDEGCNLLNNLGEYLCTHSDTNWGFALAA